MYSGTGRWAQSSVSKSAGFKHTLDVHIHNQYVILIAIQWVHVHSNEQSSNTTCIIQAGDDIVLTTITVVTLRWVLNPSYVLWLLPSWCMQGWKRPGFQKRSMELSWETWGGRSARKEDMGDAGKSSTREQELSSFESMWPIRISLSRKTAPLTWI